MRIFLNSEIGDHESRPRKQSQLYRRKAYVPTERRRDDLRDPALITADAQQRRHEYDGEQYNDDARASTSRYRLRLRLDLSVMSALILLSPRETSANDMQRPAPASLGEKMERHVRHPGHVAAEAVFRIDALVFEGQ